MKIEFLSTGGEPVQQFNTAVVRRGVNNNLLLEFGPEDTPYVRVTLTTPEALSLGSALDEVIDNQQDQVDLVSD